MIELVAPFLFRRPPQDQILMKGSWSELYAIEARSTNTSHGYVPFHEDVPFHDDRVCT